MARAGRGQPLHSIRTRVPAVPPHGALTLSGNPSLTLTGESARTGSLTLGGTASLAITGTKSTGIGPPPRPRTRWQLVAGPASGGHETGLTRAFGRRYTARLTEASELSFGYNGIHSEMAAVQELSTDIHVLWTSTSGRTVELDRLRVGPVQDTLDPGGSGAAHSVQVAGLDYRAILARRYLLSDATLAYSSVDQGEIAWELVDYTQGLPGGDLGISKAWAGTSPTGVPVDAAFEVGDSVGGKIDQLSEVVGGFDWDISPTSASAMAMQVWYPQRGTDRGVVLIYGGAAAKVQRTVDPASYANAIRYTGSTGTDTAPGPTAAELADPAIGEALQGRWEAVFGDDSLTTQAALDARAAWQLAESEVLQPVYVVTLKRGVWQGPDHIWLGDSVRLIVKSGRLDVDTVQRVYEVEVTLTESGGEVVVLTLGGRRPSYKRRAAAVERRLSALEHR